MFPRGIPRSSKDGAYGSPCALDGLLLGTCGNPTPPWRRGLLLHRRLRCDSDCNGFVPRRNTAACEPSRWDIARYVSALRSGRGRLLRPLRPRAVIGRYFESSSRSEFEGQHARHADSSSRDTSSQFPSHQENGLELSAPTMQVSSLASSSKIEVRTVRLGRPFSPLGL